MPIILIIVGVIAALGLGGYFWESSRTDVTVPTPTPVTAEVTPTPTEPTPTPTNPTPTEPTPTPTEVPAGRSPEIPAPVTASATPATTPTPSKTAYKDGSYTATATYAAPDSNTYPVTVTLTLKNDIVTESTVVFAPDVAGASASYEGRFAATYKTLVVGKTLTSINLARVGSASLTTNAWNNAQAKIAAQAKS